MKEALRNRVKSVKEKGGKRNEDEKCELETLTLKGINLQFQELGDHISTLTLFFCLVFMKRYSLKTVISDN